MTRHDSPDDRRARNETLAAIGRKLAVVLGTYLVVGVLVAALGVPWPAIVAFGVVLLVIVVTTA